MTDDGFEKWWNENADKSKYVAGKYWLEFSWQAAQKVAYERAANHCQEMLKAYPLDIFPEPPSGEHGVTVDACSARAFRHAYKLMANEIRALAEKEPG